MGGSCGRHVEAEEQFEHALAECIGHVHDSQVEVVCTPSFVRSGS